MALQSPPLILTLKLDQSTFDYVDRLRQQHFPPERNFIPAHVTLFHALPGDQEIAISQTLETLCCQTAKVSLQLPTLRFLGRGVAIDVASPELVQLRQTLANSWSQWLSPQDQQGYRSHITIQNKVSSAEARQLYEQLKAEWQPIKGFGEGLLLWYYLGGPWELANEFSFQQGLRNRGS
ncbi:2'-5' RNA ligase family protein [Kovacikia minuta CCNUW1]|uniref:2'-5' RNA ligase family protein n=1 Tax=Kovacikia minuta TaxID=2931930 RepID=UPI001CCE00C9|nr:2'-5' RNA ligase family protein [Kovacikia minuta]UBF25683.1 2'-5' RNA ligase family protein [Kovacikia minuta CCNUW1]